MSKIECERVDWDVLFRITRSKTRLKLLDPSLSSPASAVLIKALVERKRSRRFADDDRLIGDYKIKDVYGESRLWGEARSPYSKSA